MPEECAGGAGVEGFPVTAADRSTSWNVIGELKAATPLGGGNTLNGYIGAGAPIFWPSGHPTVRHDQLPGRATAPDARIGWGMDHQFDQYWSAGFKVGIQHTGGAEFETASEPFRFDHENEVIFGLNLTNTPAGNRRDERGAVIVEKMTAYGPSRHLPRSRNGGRYRSEADIAEDL